jgi:tetratricopeptide (TPR) repeat protein
MLIRSGDFARARTLLDEGLRIARAVGDRRRAAIALNDLAWLANRREELALARSAAEEALALAESEGETHLAGRIHATMGDLEERCDDLAAGRAHFEEAQRRFDSVGDLASSAKMLNNLGLIDLSLGDRITSRAALEQCLAIFSELQDAASLPTVLSNLGLIAVEDGDPARARELFLRGLRLGYRARDKELMVYTTLGLALAFGGLDNAARAATLHGIADTLSADLGMSLDSLEAGLRERSQAGIKQALGASWETRYRLGASMDVDEAMTFALEGSGEPAPAPA